MQRVAKKVGFTVSFDYVSGYMKAELAFPLASFKESYIACARFVDNPEPGSTMG